MAKTRDMTQGSILRANVFFLLFNCVNHVLAGALRGRGDARGPMIIMMACFIGVRQVYLFVVTHFVANTPVLVGFGYPVGWMSCCVVEVIYWFVWWRGKISGDVGPDPVEESLSE